MGWNLQKDNDLYLEVGSSWETRRYVVKMKDGTYHFAVGCLDADGDGVVNTYVDFDDADYEWEYADIEMWYQLLKEPKECP